MDPAAIAVLGIIATVIVGLTTLVVAFQTKRLAGATKDLASQAERQVTEMETARRLEWTPHLTFQPSSGGDNLREQHYTATITNIGRGPALNCLFIRVWGNTGRWCLSTQFDLGYGQKEEFTARESTGPRPTFLEHENRVGTILFCQEQSGACRMFGLTQQPQVSAAVDGAPPWADWYRSEIAPK